MADCACTTPGYGMTSQCLEHAGVQRRGGGKRNTTAYVLRTALRVMTVLAAQPRGVSIAQLARLLGVPKSTAERMLDAVRAVGVDVCVTADRNQRQRQILTAGAGLKLVAGHLVLDLGAVCPQDLDATRPADAATRAADAAVRARQQRETAQQESPEVVPLKAKGGNHDALAKSRAPARARNRRVVAGAVLECGRVTVMDERPGAGGLEAAAGEDGGGGLRILPDPALEGPAGAFGWAAGRSWRSDSLFEGRNQSQPCLASHFWYSSSAA